MGRTETYVYVCIRTPPPDSNLRWYILRRRKNLDASALLPIPSPPSQPREASSVVVLGWEMYVIGGLVEKKPTSDVWLLDCRTHTWRIVPSMGLARANAAAGVVDGKIYVLGGSVMSDDLSSWGEVFDPKTQTWESLSVGMDQKVYSVGGKELPYYYSPSHCQWGRGKSGHLLGNRWDWCMVDGLVYYLSKNGSIYWYEPKDFDLSEGEPKEMHSNQDFELGLGDIDEMYTNEVFNLKPLKRRLSRSSLVHFGGQSLALWEKEKIKYCDPSQLRYFHSGARITSSGSNIVVFWDVEDFEDPSCYKGPRLEIWCAEISLHRLAEQWLPPHEKHRHQVYGRIEWSNPVMTNVDPFLDHLKYKVLHSASVTL